MLSNKRYIVTSSTGSGKSLSSNLCVRVCVWRGGGGGGGGYAEGFCVRNGATFFGWIVDSQEFRKTNWVTLNERNVTQILDFVLDS